MLILHMSPSSLPSITRVIFLIIVALTGRGILQILSMDLNLECINDHYHINHNPSTLFRIIGRCIGRGGGDYILSLLIFHVPSTDKILSINHETREVSKEYDRKEENSTCTYYPVDCSIAHLLSLSPNPYSF